MNTPAVQNTQIAPVNQNEMATAGAAALQKATIEAKFTMAMHKPRNMMDVRDRLG